MCNWCAIGIDELWLLALQCVCFNETSTKKMESGLVVTWCHTVGDTDPTIHVFIMHGVATCMHMIQRGCALDPIMNAYSSVVPQLQKSLHNHVHAR